MRKIMKIKEWLKTKKIVKLLEDNAAKSPLLDSLMSIEPESGSPKGKIFYLDYRYGNTKD